jgi:hypothetical protein
MTTFTRSARGALVAALTLSVAGVPLVGTRSTPPVGPAASQPAGASVAAAARDRALPPGWRTSGDVAWTTRGDATGLHVLVAEARTGYTWRTAATLAEPGLEADQWVGNACVTASGRRVVVAYAPRAFTNEAVLHSRGAFTAIVDLRDGGVRKLPVTSSLAHFNPGCGAGEAVALTQEGDEHRPGTRLSILDAATGRLGGAVAVTGQVTSAVPVGDGLVAARGPSVVRLDARGRTTVIGRTDEVPFRLRPDAAGGVSFLERTPAGLAARRLAGGHTTVLAEGPVGAVGLSRGAGGRVFLTGTATPRVAGTPVMAVAAPADADVSTLGELAVRHVPAAAGSAPSTMPARAVPGSAQPVTLAATVPRTRKALGFSFRPVPGGPGLAAVAPVRGAASAAATTGAAGGGDVRAAAVDAQTDPVDHEAWCAVPRNDRVTLAYQPTPRQVEWAVDYAIQNQLTLTRPAGFKNFGLPAYSPQGMFPPRQMAGGGHVPPQILLGILAQESNLWQATRYARSGEYANSLIGNYYGRQLSDENPLNDWEIHWDDSDCGYGIGQVTDGMRKPNRLKPGEVAKSAVQQRAIALDYAANIAASLQILQDKWNQTRLADLVVNDGDATRVENWFFAAWAYNSGMYPDRGDGSPWGVGWFNNPANPRYPADRPMFLDPFYKNGSPRSGSAADAAHPQDWPYPEKVLGWAAQSIATDDGPGFRPAWWITAEQRTKATPPIHQFCDESNDCSPGASQQPNDPEVENEPPGPCLHRNAQGLFDLRCWYNSSSVWKPDCSSTCGNEVVRFDIDDAHYPEQPDGTHRFPRCDRAGLPADALIVDDVPAGTPATRCGSATRTDGTFSLYFAGIVARNEWSSKIDFHQLGGGYGGHYWFTHAGEGLHSGGEFFLQATWKPPAGLLGLTDVYVFLPEDKSRVENAVYQVYTGDRRERDIQVDQNANSNRWFKIGRFDLKGNAEVVLNNHPDVRYGDAITFDAVAFAPVSG